MADNIFLSNIKDQTFESQVMYEEYHPMFHNRLPAFKLSLACNRRVEFVYKEVLTSRCKYFDMMLREPWEENNFDKIILNFDVKFKSLKAVLDFFDTGSVKLTGRNVFEVCAMSRYLVHEELIGFCSQYLSKAISHESMHVIDLFAKIHFMPEVSVAVRKFWRVNFGDYLYSDDFEVTKWSHELVTEVVSSDELEVANECKMASLVNKWIKVNCDGSEESLRISFDLISKVRLDYMHPVKQALLNEIWLNDFCRRFAHRETWPKPNFNHRQHQKGVYMLKAKKQLALMPESELVCYRKGELFTEHLKNFDSRFASALMEVKGNLYLIFDQTFKVDGVDNSACMLVYEPVQRVWSTKELFSSPRTVGYTTCASGGNLYVFGGNPYIAWGIPSEVYSPDADAWMKLPTIFNRRNVTTAVSIKDSIFLISPATGIRHQYFKVEEMKPKSNELIELPYQSCLRMIDLSYHIPRVVAVESRLFIFKGNRKVVVYDTETRLFHENYFMSRPQRILGMTIQSLFVYHEKIHIYYQGAFEGSMTNEYRLVVLDPTVLDNVGRYLMKRQMRKLFHSIVVVWSELPGDIQHAVSV